MEGSAYFTGFRGGGRRVHVSYDNGEADGEWVRQVSEYIDLGANQGSQSPFIQLTVRSSKEFKIQENFVVIRIACGT